MTELQISKKLAMIKKKVPVKTSWASLLAISHVVLFKGRRETPGNLVWRGKFDFHGVVQFTKLSLKQFHFNFYGACLFLCPIWELCSDPSSVKLEGVTDTEFSRHRLSWSGMKNTRTQQGSKAEDGSSPRAPSLAAAWGQYFRDRISGGGFELDSIFYSSKLLLGNHIIWVQLLKSFQFHPCSLQAFSSGVFVEEKLCAVNIHENEKKNWSM